MAAHDDDDDDDDDDYDDYDDDYDDDDDDDGCHVHRRARTNAPDRGKFGAACFMFPGRPHRQPETLPSTTKYQKRATACNMLPQACMANCSTTEGAFRCQEGGNQVPQIRCHRRGL